jgi:carboxyl-terminal processing protease
MNLRVPLGAAIAFALVIAALTFSITMNYSRSDYNERASFLREREAANGKFAEIDRQVRQKYYGAISEAALMDSVARGYLSGIGDPYASYLTAEEFARQAQTIISAKVGIGAVLEISPEGYLLVTEVYPDSPAQAEGIAVGDLIVKMDDIDLTIENIEQQAALMEDAVGTKVLLTVRKGGEDVTADITRREIAIPTVYGSVIPDTSIGYMIITEFSDRTLIQFNRELSRLQNLGVQALIFDLRDNKGGVLYQAARVLDRLVPAGPLVGAVYRDGTVFEVETSDANQIDMPMVTLTNANTAEAAELFVQVLRDYGMGDSVGVTTAGRGSMQEQIQLSDGSAISITVARYTPPSGENFDGVGIKPDFEVAMTEGLENWRELDHLSDPQLAKALSVAEGILLESQSAS